MSRRLYQAKSYQVGDKEKFWISNSDTAEHRQGHFTLLYITPHSYFWAEDGAEVNEGDMKALMDTFEEKIYPTDREFFGSEANPGVDGDPHIYVLYASMHLGTISEDISTLPILTTRWSRNIPMLMRRMC